MAAHQRRLQRLYRRATSGGEVAKLDADPHHLAYDRYPSQIDRVLPTSLGNVIRAGEDYGPRRYGFNTIYLWPRLVTVLDDAFVRDLERTIMRYQLPLVVSFWSALLCASTTLLIHGHVPVTAFVAAFLGTGSFSYLAYRLSIASARDYADLLRAAVDTGHKRLLESWWPELLTIDDDRIRLAALEAFVIRNEPIAAPPPQPGRGGQLRTGQTSGTPDPRTTVDEDAAVALREEIRLSPRWRTIMAISFAVVAIAGSSCMGRRVDVLVARHPIDAFSPLADTVITTSVARNVVPHDAIKPEAKSADNGLGLASRRLQPGAVLRTSDTVLPAVSSVVPTEQRTILAVIQPADVLASLDLRGGDRVRLVAAAARLTADGPNAAAEKGQPSDGGDAMVDAIVVAVSAQTRSNGVVTLLICSADVPHLEQIGLDAVRMIRPGSGPDAHCR